METLDPARAFVFLVNLVVALIAVLLGVTVLLGARDRRAATAFAIFCACTVGWSSGMGLQSLPGFFKEHKDLITASRCGFLFLPAATLHLLSAWLLPTSRPLKTAMLLAYGLSTALTVANWQGLVFAELFHYRWGAMTYPGPVYPVMVFYMCGVLFAALLVTAYAFRTVSDPETRLRTKYLLTAAAISLPLGTANFLPNYGVRIPPVGIVAMASFLLIVSYALLHRRLLDIDVVSIKALAAAYSAVAIACPLIGLAYAAYLFGLDLSGPAFMPVMFISAASGAAFFTRLRAHLEREVEHSFFPARRAAREAVEDFSRRVFKFPGKLDLGKELVSTLEASFGLRGVAFYVAENDNTTLTLTASAGTIAAPPVLEAGMLASLPASGIPPGDAAGNTEERSFDWTATVSVGPTEKPLAMIVLGNKRSGAALSDAEEMLLSALASQVAIALSIAGYVSQIEEQRTRIEAQEQCLGELRRRAQGNHKPPASRLHSPSRFREIIGSSPPLLHVLGVIERVANSRASVLVTGETGTGKELAARALHELSGRNGALVSINCAAIPGELAEATFFGYERGAFTGAVESHPGKFEAAHQGTIVLDEIGELSMPMQTKLLRVLQEQETQRLGSHSVRKLDLRVVATTNRDLRVEVQGGRFRADLFYRLATVVVELPPLRERIDDVPLLATHFLDRAVRNRQNSILGFAPEAMDALCQCAWPGNVRELQNVIERAVLLCDGEEIDPEHLPELAAPAHNGTHLRAAVRDEKTRRIRQALLETGGNKAQAARQLGLTPSNLGRLMKSLGM